MREKARHQRFKADSSARRRIPRCFHGRCKKVKDGVAAVGIKHTSCTTRTEHAVSHKYLWKTNTIVTNGPQKTLVQLGACDATFNCNLKGANGKKIPYPHL
jgi:hypothetical protein